MFEKIPVEGNSQFLTELDVTTNAHLFSIDGPQPLLEDLAFMLGIDQPTCDLYAKFARRSLNVG